MLIRNDARVHACIELSRRSGLIIGMQVFSIPEDDAVTDVPARKHARARLLFSHLSAMKFDQIIRCAPTDNIRK
jgi:hypothetical protein